MSSLLDLLRAKKQEIAAANGDRMKTIKPVDGSGRYRILPSWRGEGQQFWHDFGQHFIKNADKKIAAIYVCTEKTYGKPCAVCAAIEQGFAATASSDEFTNGLLKEAKSSSRILVNALHMDGGSPGEVKILELSPTAFGAFLSIMEQYEDAEQSIFDMTTGRDVIITRTGTGLQTKYTVMAAVKTSPLDPAKLAKLHNLDEYVQQESTAQQLRALNSVRAVTGLLSAPVSSGTGMAVRGAAPIEDDPYAAAPAPAPVARKAPVVADVEDVAVKPRPAAPAVSEGTGDDDLDKLLAELG